MDLKISLFLYDQLIIKGVDINTICKNLNNNVISFDPIYRFTKEELINRIKETKYEFQKSGKKMPVIVYNLTIL